MAQPDHGANATSVSFGGCAPHIFAAAAVDATPAAAAPADGTAAADSLVRGRNLANAFSGPTQNQALPGSTTPRPVESGRPDWIINELQARAGIGGSDTNGRGQHRLFFSQTPSPIGT